MRRAFLTVLAPLSLLAATLFFALPAAAAPFSGDAITTHDQTEYQQGDFAHRFNIAFKSHVRVCTNATSGASCDARVTTDGSGTPQAALAPAGYGPAQFLKAYALSGQTAASKPPVIAIIDAYGDSNIQSDLDTYSSAFGIPTLPACAGAVAGSNAACFQKVNEQGGTTYPATNAGWSLETALDVEVAHATCQNCSILLVEASTNNYYDLMAAVDRAVALGATVVSNSYGSSEFFGENVYDSHFNHPGVAFTFSAGDAGYGVEYPAASPYVTAVGGTSLFLNSDGSYSQELAWSGTGSGCSAYESKPTWQIDSGCAQRTVADVSADADPNTGAAVYDSVPYSGRTGWFQVGGTSLASPLVAAVYAQGGVQSGVQANSLPYSRNTSSNLHDVANGSNGACGGLYLCTALLGYDGPTGLGSPSGISAFSSFVSSPLPPAPVSPAPPVLSPPAPVSSFTISTNLTSLSVYRGNSGNDTITVNPAGGFTGSVRLSVSGLPSGVSAGFSKNPTPSSSTLRLSTSRRTPTGAYTLTIQGASGSLAATTALTLIIR